MRLHANAVTCPKSRFKIVCRVLNGEARETIAAEYEISTRTIAKWVAGYYGRQVDVSDDRAVKGGSAGDPLAVAARDAFERDPAERN